MFFIFAKNIRIWIASSEIVFVVAMNKNDLEMFQIHIRCLLLDTVTGYHSQYHGLLEIGSL